MSVALYITLEAPVEDFDACSVSGKAVARANEELANLSQELGTPPLLQFFSVSAAEVEQLVGVAALENMPAEEWFEPAEGLRAVRPLIQRLRSDLQAAADPRTDAILADLLAMEAVLTAARTQGVRFHFAIDF